MTFLTQNIQNILVVGLFILGIIATCLVFIVARLSHIQSSLDDLSTTIENAKKAQNQR